MRGALLGADVVRRARVVLRRRLQHLFPEPLRVLHVPRRRFRRLVVHAREPRPAQPGRLADDVRRRAREQALHDQALRVEVERRAPGEDLGEHDAQRVDVVAKGVRVLETLRVHPVDLSPLGAAQKPTRVVVLGQRVPGKHHLSEVPLYQHVLAVDVLVHEVAFVQKRDALRDVGQGAEQPRGGAPFSLELALSTRDVVEERRLVRFHAHPVARELGEGQNTQQMRVPDLVTGEDVHLPRVLGDRLRGPAPLRGSPRVLGVGHVRQPRRVHFVVRPDHDVPSRPARRSQDRGEHRERPVVQQALAYHLDVVLGEAHRQRLGHVDVACPVRAVVLVRPGPAIARAALLFSTGGDAGGGVTVRRGSWRRVTAGRRARLTTASVYDRRDERDRVRVTGSRGGSHLGLMPRRELQDALHQLRVHELIALHHTPKPRAALRALVWA